MTSQSYTRAAMLGLFGQWVTCITGAGIVIGWEAMGAPSLARANAPRQGARVLSIASGACPALGSSQPRRAPAMPDTRHGSAYASSVMCFGIAHPNASNVFKATFVLQCCIDSNARALHCNALQPRHWRAMPDTLTHSAAAARHPLGSAGTIDAGLGWAVLEAASGMGWARLGAGCQLWETPRA